MTATYEPGTVALVQKNGGKWHRALYMDGIEGGKWACIHTHNCRPDDVRPLVVLDPEDIDTAPQDTIPYLVRALRASDGDGYGPTLRMLADQIEAQTRPPKPAEPLGLGAVVEDAEGERWVRVDSDDYPWFAPESRDFSPYSRINAVRVLSEGVQ